MMEMKWIFDRGNSLVARWEDPRIGRRDVCQYLTEGIVPPATAREVHPGKAMVSS